MPTVRALLCSGGREPALHATPVAGLSGLRRYTVFARFDEDTLLIEHAAPSDLYWPFYLAQVDDEGDAHGSNSGHATVEDAQAAAQDDHAEPLVWKTAPRAWQPDAILVSQYLTDDEDQQADR